MIRKLAFLIVWFQVTCIVLLFNLSFLSAYKQGATTSIPYPTQLYPNFEIQKAIPASSGKVLGSSITAEDARTLIIERFIKRFRPDSPFLNHAQIIVEEADLYQIDYSYGWKNMMWKSYAYGQSANNGQFILQYTPTVSGIYYLDVSPQYYQGTWSGSLNYYYTTP